MAVEIVVAMDRGGVIGRDGGLPWPKLPRDMARFRRLTLHRTVVMGRKTAASIPSFPLPDRYNVVLSRKVGIRYGDGFVVNPSLADVMETYSDREPVVVLGGAMVFAATLAECRRIHLTVVDGDFPGDVRFPLGPLPWPGWREESAESHPADDRNSFGMTFSTLTRVEDDR